MSPIAMYFISFSVRRQQAGAHQQAYQLGFEFVVRRLRSLLVGDDHDIVARRQFREPLPDRRAQPPLHGVADDGGTDPPAHHETEAAVIEVVRHGIESQPPPAPPLPLLSEPPKVARVFQEQLTERHLWRPGRSPPDLAVPVGLLDVPVLRRKLLAALGTAIL